jgi:hypothetical protein
MIEHDKSRPGLINSLGVARLTKRSGLAEVLIKCRACARPRARTRTGFKSSGQKKAQTEVWAKSYLLHIFHFEGDYRIIQFC